MRWVSGLLLVLWVVAVLPPVQAEDGEHLTREERIRLREKRREERKADREAGKVEGEAAAEAKPAEGTDPKPDEAKPSTTKPLGISAVEAKPVITKHQEAFLEARATYRKALFAAKVVAASKSDVEEVKRMEEACTGVFTGEFTTPAAKTAKDRYDARLASIAKALASELSGVVRTLLAKPDGITQAEEAQGAIDTLNSFQKIPDKTFTVSANETWQDSGIEVKKGQTITFTCTGTWSPHRIRVGKDTWRHVPGDADTYPVQVAIGEKRVKAGKTAECVAPQDGVLKFRMEPVGAEARLADAEGDMKVKISLVAAEGPGLETVLLQVLAIPE